MVRVGFPQSLFKILLNYIFKKINSYFFSYLSLEQNFCLKCVSETGSDPDPWMFMDPLPDQDLSNCAFRDTQFSVESG